MRTRLTFAVSLLLLTGCGGGGAGSQYTFDDPEVTRIYNRMMEVMAPDGGWERARYLEFDWAIGQNVRRHRWDRWEGWARYETQAQGQTQVVIFNTNDLSTGRVWLDGVEVTGEEAQTRITAAYRGHINDSYWLIMPYKWSDPGVRLRYLGEQTDDAGRRWEVVELAFDDGIGLTPQNMYRAFINPETGRMERWHHFPSPDAEAAPSDWTEWQRYGPIELAENRRGPDGLPRIFFPHLRVETSVPAGAFDPPTG
jgi:hypothetical protein